MASLLERLETAAKGGSFSDQLEAAAGGETLAEQLERAATGRPKPPELKSYTPQPRSLMQRARESGPAVAILGPTDEQAMRKHQNRLLLERDFPVIHAAVAKGQNPEDFLTPQEQEDFKAQAAVKLKEKGVPETITRVLLAGGPVGDVAAGIIPPIAGSVIGTYAGGPVGTMVGGAVGGALGDALVQAREYARGERTSLAPGRMAGAATLGAFVPKPLQVAGGKLAPAVIDAMVTRGGQAAVLGGGAELIAQGIDEGKLDLNRALKAGVIAIPFGAGFGALEATLPRVWGKIRGKTPEEAKVVLAEEPSNEAVVGAQQQIDQMLNIGAPAKSALAAADVLNVVPSKSAEESARAIESQLAIKSAQQGNMERAIAGRQGVEPELHPDAARIQQEAFDKAPAPKSNEPEAPELSIQAQRMVDEYGGIDPRVMAKLAQHGVGAAGGFALGMAEGKDLPPEQRLANALAWAAATGGIAPVLARRMIAAAFKSTPLSPSIAAKLTPAQPGQKTLADVERIFSADPSQKPTIYEKAVALSGKLVTAAQNIYNPITELETQVLGKRQKLPLGDRFSLVAGAAGKAEAGIYELETLQNKLIPDVTPLDLNVFLALRRTLDRLETEGRLKAQAQAALAAGQPAQEVTSRAVSDFDIPDTQRLLGELHAKLGTDKMQRVEQFAQAIQQSTDADLQLMVQSGRMSQAQYSDIKAMNDFYAPFKVMKYQEAMEGLPGAGRAIDTTQPLTKAITGIEDKEFRLGDMMTAVKQNKLRAFILAEKNRAMLGLADVAGADTNGLFIKELKPHHKAPDGWATVNFMRDGKQLELAVAKPVADAVKGLDPLQLGIVGRTLAYAATPLRLGATGANVAFQVVNQFKDQARMALVSKYGLRGPSDIYRYPLDFADAVVASWASNVFNHKNSLALEYLKSGAARSTISSQLSPDSFMRIAQQPNQSVAAKMMGIPARTILDSIAKVGNAIEETTKMMGMRRGMRSEGFSGSGTTTLSKLGDKIDAAFGLNGKATPTGAARQDALDRVAYEVRNYAGSPDFAKHGTVGLEMNLVFMFANARVQGAAADLRRLMGRTGNAEAASAAARLATAVGLPTVALWYYNQRPENVADFASRPTTEKNNYWLIPRYSQDGAPLYFTNDKGEKVREYYRIPKNDILAQVSNTINGAMDYAKTKDPQAAFNAGVSFLENLSPVPVGGRNLNERIESMISGVNPVIKTPVELGIGRDTFRHRDIIPQRQKDASPNLQFTSYTPGPFIRAAQTMPGWLPDRLRSPLHLQQLTQNLTAGALTQFMRPEQEGRSPLTGNVLLGRFFSSPYNNNEDDWNTIGKLRTSSTDRSLIRERAMEEFLNQASKMKPQERISSALRIFAVDPEKNIPAFVNVATDRAAGTTDVDRAVRSLESRERAQYLEDKMNAIPSKEGQRQYMIEMLKKRILTEDTANELVKLRSLKAQAKSP